MNVRILEVDAERRRLSLSLKRVEDGMPLQPGAGEDAAPPTIDLSEDVFSDDPAPAAAAEAPPRADAEASAEARELDDRRPTAEAAADDEPRDEPAEGSDDDRARE